MAGRACNLIKTEKVHIPIGEPVILDDGNPGLRIKGKGQVFDTISLSSLGKMLYNAIGSNKTKK